MQFLLIKVARESGITTYVCNSPNLKCRRNCNTNIKNAESLSRKNREFLDLTFEYGFVSVTNKPIRVIKTTPTVIDHIITNSVLHGSIDTTIFQLDISDHFAIS